MKDLLDHCVQHHGFQPGDYPESDRALLESAHREDHEAGTALIVDGEGIEREVALTHNHEAADHG